MTRWTYIFALICYAPIPAVTQVPAPPKPPADQVQTVLSQPLPSFKGEHMTVEVVRVHYAPGQSTPAHSHPCPVMGYVLEGAVRMQVQAPATSQPGPVTVYRAKDSFYEAPNGRHLVSANASQTEPATFLATFLCDHPTPLVVPVRP